MRFVLAQRSIAFCTLQYCVVKHRLRTAAKDFSSWCSIFGHIAFGARDLGFDSQVAQIKHSVANGSSLLRRFLSRVA